MKNLATVILLSCLVIFAACARYDEKIQTEILPEKELYDLAMLKFNEQNWNAAIATFDRFERLYFNSPDIQEIRLKRADSYFNRGSVTSLILAKSEYENYLSLYASNEHEDYVWFQIAQCNVKQMLPPNRDQYPTKNAIKDLEKFLERFPNSQYVPQARESLNTAYSSLAAYNFRIGKFYYRVRSYSSSAGRFKQALEQDVEQEDLEELYFMLTLSLARSAEYYGIFYDRSPEEINEKMIELYLKEYRQSKYEANQYLNEYREHFPDNTKRIDELQLEVKQIIDVKERESKSDEDDEETGQLQ